MILALGGRPDEDKVENNLLIEQMTATEKEIKEELEKAKNKLMERQEIIKVSGF
jgi:hypothetical protein